MSDDVHVHRVMANLPAPDLDAARAFWSGVLGMPEEPMGPDWVTRFVDPASGAAVQAVVHDATAPVDSVASVQVDDVDAAHARAAGKAWRSCTRSPTSRGACAASSCASRAAPW